MVDHLKLALLEMQSIPLDPRPLAQRLATDHLVSS